MVKLQCLNGHEYQIYFDTPTRPECSHTGEKVRGVCVQCAMAAPQRDPDPRCPECGSKPARILEQPALKIKIIRG